VAAAVKEQNDPAAGLRMFLSRIVGEIARRDEGAWELRVLSREILSPTAMMDRMLTTQVAPKAKLVSGMIGRMLGLPPTHPAVGRCIVSLMGPCIMLLMVSQEVIGKVFPSLTLDADAMSEHLLTFALGGIKAIAAKGKKAKG
jgi:TetR/AcrR family transcriptional regulator, regulator of cefoperazone and chloramphenicol sensitivity